MKKITLIPLFVLAFVFSLGLNAQSTAIYDISFTSTWNSNDHGTLPSNAHWSNLVGANHNEDVVFLKLDETATTGVENVAEAGSNTVFKAEVQNAINNGNAEQWLQTPFSPFAAISTATLNDIIITDTHPHLSLISMIAPSPDWMIAINSLNLWDSNLNAWKDSFGVDLYPYDAGTENGFSYDINNAPTNPRGVISNIAGAEGYPFNSEKIGTLTLTLKSVTLGINDNNHLDKIQLTPNPCNTGSVKFTHTAKVDAITLYDILGKKVKHLTLTSSVNTMSVNVSNLSKGVYIVKLASINGQIISKKLIIN